METRELIELIAKVWRAIGQPDINGLSVLVAVGTVEWEAAEATILGMPVIEVGSPINGRNVAIGCPFDGWSEVPDAFAAKWTDFSTKE